MVQFTPFPCALQLSKCNSWISYGTLFLGKVENAKAPKAVSAKAEASVKPKGKVVEPSKDVKSEEDDESDEDEESDTDSEDVDEVFFFVGVGILV